MAENDKDKGGVRVLRGVRGLEEKPEDAVLVRTDEPVYVTADGVHKAGAGDRDDAFQVLAAGSTVTAAQAREYGLSDSVDPAKLEERREQFPDFLGGSAVVDKGTVVPVTVAGSTRSALDPEQTVQTAEQVEERVQDAISAHREGRPTKEQKAADDESEEQKQQREASASRRVQSPRTSQAETK